MMAGPEDAGSIFSAVRIKIDKLRQDIVQVTALMDQVNKGVTDSTDKTSKKATANFSAIKVAAVAASAAVITAFRSLITETSAYSAALGDLRAATRGNSAELEQLATSAEAAGKAVGASSTEAIKAEVALAKAGVSTADIMGGALTGALTLAAAGTMDVSDAAEIAAATMTQFGLAGDDVVHIADLLAAGAGKAQGEVSDLSQALKQAGLVASQTGLSIDDTVGTLAAFASAGLLGSDAGTSFRTMLLRLTPQSKEAADEMERLGLNAFDAQGDFIGIEKFAGQLQAQLKDLTTEQRNSALATIFGSDSIRAANVLYTQGATGINEWIGKVNDSGFAADTAALKLDNLNGDLQKFAAQASTSAAKIGSSLEPTLRGVTQAGTAFLDFIDGIPAPLAAGASAALAVAAAFGAITLSAGILAPALAALGITIGASFAPITLAAGAFLALAAGITAASDAVNKGNVDKAAATFGDIAVNSGLAGLELQKFAQKASDAEQFLGAMGRDSAVTGKAFERLAKDMGLTNDQLAQIALRSARSSTEVKNLATEFIDGEAAAKRFASANLTLATTLRDAWRTATPAEIKKVEDALKSIPAVVEDTTALTAGELEAQIFVYTNATNRIRDLIEERMHATQEAATSEAEAIQFSNESVIMSYTAASNRVRDIIEARMHGITETSKAEAEAQLKSNIDLASGILETFSALASSLSSIFATMYQAQIDDATRAYDHDRELLENNGLTKKQALEKEVSDKLAAGDTTGAADAQKALDLYNLEAEFTRKKADLEYQAALTQWKFNVAIAAANAANGILKAVTGAPWPLNIPAIAFASLIGGAQIAAVGAAQPKPPAFATGGLVLPSGQSGQQVTVGDQGGGDILFGTGALGAPLMQGFAQMVADMVRSGGSGAGQTIVVHTILDGKIIATSTAKLIDDGVVPMRSLNR